MSTHCGIAIKSNNEGYRYIYVHNDGYPSYMWPMLTKHYNSEELANKLIMLGDASFIDELLEPTGDYHKFGMPEPRVSMFYHRDRGEEWECARPSYGPKDRFLSAYYHAYIWEDGKWNYYEGRKLKEVVEV